MISGHVHLLSILSWGILVYQTSMSFLLHFILQHGHYIFYWIFQIFLVVYIDNEITTEQRMSFHPNTNEKTIFIKTTDLMLFIESIGYQVNIIDL